MISWFLFSCWEKKIQFKLHKLITTWKLQEIHCWRKHEKWYKKASFFSYLNSATDETTYDTVKWSLFYQGLLEGETVDKNEIEITDKILLSTV